MKTISHSEAVPIAEAFPLPDHIELQRSYWKALQDGRLTFQQCNVCHNAWLPERDFCPHCLSSDWSWKPASGRARLISWVVYHRTYHPSFEQRIPYVVAIVELVEGPRMISNITNADFETLHIDEPLSLVMEKEHGVIIPRFTPDRTKLSHTPALDS